jgi:hypothetical protein
MPITRTQTSQIQYHEIFGQVIGLFGDPTNQDTLAGGVLTSTAFNHITWSGATDIQKALFWSRVLLCVLFSPSDPSFLRAKIALVLKPRSLWLFSNAGQVADYIGNSVDVSALGTADADGLITSVNPPYNFGDFIRIGTLPTSLNVTNWTNSYTALYSEYYDVSLGTVRDPALAVSGMSIQASAFVPAIADFSVSKIVYYDKNTDGRTRIVGGASGGDVTVPLCIGGVTQVYKLKGTRVA